MRIRNSASGSTVQPCAVYNSEFSQQVCEVQGCGSASFDADLGPTFHFDADPDPVPDPTIRKSDLFLLLYTAMRVYFVKSFSSAF